MRGKDKPAAVSRYWRVTHGKLLEVVQKELLVQAGVEARERLYVATLHGLQ